MPVWNLQSGSESRHHMHNHTNEYILHTEVNALKEENKMQSKRITEYLLEVE